MKLQLKYTDLVVLFVLKVIFLDGSSNPFLLLPMNKQPNERLYHLSHPLVVSDGFETDWDVRGFIDQSRDFYELNLGLLFHKRPLLDGQVITGFYVSSDVKKEQDAAFSQVTLGANTGFGRFGLNTNIYSPVIIQDQPGSVAHNEGYVYVPSQRKALSGWDLDMNYRISNEVQLSAGVESFELTQISPRLGLAYDHHQHGWHYQHRVSYEYNRGSRRNLINFSTLLSHSREQSEVDSNKILSHHQRDIHIRTSPRCAIMTIMKGAKEKTLKTIVPQNLPCDLWAFLDTPAKDLQKSGQKWKQDFTSYHDQYRTPFDNLQYRNTLLKSNSDRARYKWYKLQPHRIPVLRHYDMLIGIDANVTIVHSDFTKMMWKTMSKNNSALVLRKHPKTLVQEYYQHDEYSEVLKLKNLTRDDKQCIIEQAYQYQRDGFTASNEKKATGPYKFMYAESSVIGINLAHAQSKKIMDHWYHEVLKFSLRDQLGLHYVLWKYHYYPYITTVDLGHWKSLYTDQDRRHRS